MSTTVSPSVPPASRNLVVMEQPQDIRTTTIVHANHNTLLFPQSRPTSSTSSIHHKSNFVQRILYKVMTSSTSTSTTTTTTTTLNRSLRKRNTMRKLKKIHSRPLPPTTTIHTDGGSSTSTSSTNVMQWLEQSCPEDVLPLILAYCGPQMVSTMNQLNRFWNHSLQQEGTWRILCEQLYKWKQGEDEIPNSWKEFYCLRPCVPIDYSTINKALEAVTDTVATKKKKKNNHEDSIQQQKKDIKILLRPGYHFVKESIVIDDPYQNVIVESMKMPNNLFFPPTFRNHNNDPVSMPLLETSPSLTTTGSRTRSTNRVKAAATSLRTLMNCRSSASTQVVEGQQQPQDHNMDFLFPEERHHLPMFSPEYDPYHNNSHCSLNQPMDRACVYSQLRRQNEPIFRVRRGNLTVKKLDLTHSCNGIDIWNGNAAIQVQPPVALSNDTNDTTRSNANPRNVPYVSLDQVQVTSKTGRGVVAIDGGNVNMKNSLIRDCAATGLYIGGPCSVADIQTTDVINNGIGNTTFRRGGGGGIARGHSGVYLEQGKAKIYKCNISKNALTGISAVSHENCTLWLEDSELSSNGSYQLELPPPGTNSRRNAINRNNRLSISGLPRSRSGLIDMGVYNNDNNSDHAAMTRTED